MSNYKKYKAFQKASEVFMYRKYDNKIFHKSFISKFVMGFGVTEEEIKKIETKNWKELVLNYKIEQIAKNATEVRIMKRLEHWELNLHTLIDLYDILKYGEANDYDYPTLLEYLINKTNYYYHEYEKSVVFVTW